MDARLICAVFLPLIFCFATIQGAAEERPWTSYDLTYGHYALGLLTAETIILESRNIIFQVEVNFTLKYIGIDILAKLTELGTNETNVAALRDEMLLHQLSVIDSANLVIKSAQDLLNVTTFINQNFENQTQNELMDEKLLLQREMNTLNLLSGVSRDQILFVLISTKNSINQLVGNQTGTIVDDINALTSQAQTVMMDEQNRITAQLNLVNVAHVKSENALQNLINTAPVDYNMIIMTL